MFNFVQPTTSYLINLNATRSIEHKWEQLCLSGTIPTTHTLYTIRAWNKNWELVSHLIGCMHNKYDWFSHQKYTVLFPGLWSFEYRRVRGANGHFKPSVSFWQVTILLLTTDCGQWQPVILYGIESHVRSCLLNVKFLITWKAWNHKILKSAYKIFVAELKLMVCLRPIAVYGRQFSAVHFNDIVIYDLYMLLLPISGQPT